LVAKLQARLAHWDVNTTEIGDILIEMVSNDMLNIIMCNCSSNYVFSLNHEFSVGGEHIKFGEFPVTLFLLYFEFYTNY